jgi:predicted MFS family arabinose efflux permease
MANEVVNLMFGVWMEDAFGLQIMALGAASAVIGISELSGEGLTALLVDRLGKERSILVGLVLNGLSAAMLPFLGTSVAGGLAGLFFFYLTFEFTIVSSLPLLTEILPSARATLMGMYIAIFSLGRALGALIAPQLYVTGFWLNAVAALALDLLAILCLMRIRIPVSEDPPQEG